jgi:hypothetical protein
MFIENIDEGVLQGRAFGRHVAPGLMAHGSWLMAHKHRHSLAQSKRKTQSDRPCRSGGMRARLLQHPKHLINIGAACYTLVDNLYGFDFTHFPLKGCNLSL